MPDIFDLDSRHPKYSKAAPEPDFEVVEVNGTKFEIIVSPDPYGWVAECGPFTRWASNKQAAIESILEDLQIEEE